MITGIDSDGLSNLGGHAVDAVLILTGAKAVEAVRALNDESRRQILHALRARTMSTTELCEFLGRQGSSKEIKPQTVRYHLKMLEQSGLIRQDGFAPAGNGDTHIMQKLWRATAESIFIATGSMEDLPERPPKDIEQSLDLVKTLKALGFKIPNYDDVVRLAEQYVEKDNLMRKGRERAKKILSEADQVDPALYMTLLKILSIITLDNADYNRYLELDHEILEKFRKAFQAGCGANPEVY